MGSRITFYGRADASSADAMQFLKQARYAADRVVDIDREPLRGEDLVALRRPLGGSLAPLVDVRHPDYSRVFPEGLDALSEEQIHARLEDHQHLVRTPVLVTPKGAVAGFREQRWRSFLGLGALRGG